MPDENVHKDNIQIITLWVDKYSDELFSWAYYKTSQREAAHDLVQDTFLSAFQGLSQFENRSTPKTWLFSILNNKIIDYHRKRARSIISNETDINVGSDDNFFETFFDENDKWKKLVKPSVWNESENLTDDVEFLKVLYYCIGNLPQLWNSAIQLKYISEKDGKEICKELDISSSNYWQILHRAKLQLRQCIEKNWFKE